MNRTATLAIFSGTFSILAVLLVPVVVKANFDIFNDPTEFLAAADNVFFESFETQPANNVTNQLFFELDNFTVTANEAELGIFNTPNVGGNPTDGTQYLGISADIVTFDLDTSVNSFAFSLIDFGDNGDGELTFSNSAGEDTVVSLSGGGDGNVQFFGFVNPNLSFDQVVLTNTVPGEFYAIDAISSANAIPEPIAIPLLALCASPFALSTRR